MGTKLEYAINLLEPSSNSTSFNVHFVDDHLEYLQTRGLNNINFQITGIDKYHHHHHHHHHHSSLVNRMPETHNIDLIRKTMQMHEDIFKHQVRELHRLYSVQKMLMEELKKEIKQNKKYWSPMTTASSNIINSHPFLNQQLNNNNNNSTTVQSSYQCSINFQSLRDDPSPRERTGSCSGDTMRMAKGFEFDLERPAEEDISTAGTSSFVPFGTSNHKMSIDGSDEDSEVELTLSIGGCTNKKISANQELGNRRTKVLDSPASFKSERGEDCSSTPTTPMSSSSATFDHERKQPHWLFQGLSINRTN